MITRKFIEKVHDTFDELNYHETEQLDFDKFEKSAIRTLTHCKDLSDAVNAVRMYQFCLKKWNKIERLFNRKLQIFNEYNYEGNSLISLVPDEEAFSTYYITNGINRKIRDISVAGFSLGEEELFAFGFKNGRFAFEDGNYYMKYSKMTSRKMKLFDNQNKCLCSIVLRKDLGVFLKNNSTPYDIVIYDDFIGVYDKAYIDGLSDTDVIDINKRVADIEWDILEKNSEFGVAELNVYEPNVDFEMLLLFASSTFLIFQKNMQAMQLLLAGTALSSINRMSFWARK